MFVALCAALALLAVPSHEQGTQGSALPSPCPDVFVYDPPGTEPGWWSGVVTLSTDIPLHSVWLNIELDRQALSLGQLWDWIGNVTTQDNVSFIIENDEMQIHPGHPVSARFFIQYDTLITTPRLRTIRLNGKVICNADKDQGANVGKPFLSNTNERLPGSVSSQPKTNINLNDTMTMPASQSEPNYSVHPDPVNNSSAASKFLNRFFDLLYEM